MNRHQVLTGAVNSGDQCFAVGSVEAVNFTAYATGCDIVILASDFQRVQIIPGAVHGSIQVTCIDSCSDSGKIAVSYGHKVCIFEPTPLIHQDSSHKLDYQWYHTGTVETDYEVQSLSWNQEGTKLLTGGDVIKMWQSPDTGPRETVDSMFYIEDQEEQLDWICVWQCRPATPVTQIQFSSDGLLFASVGKNDRLVKIWYENKRVQLPLMRGDSISPKKDDLHYSFIYIAHPRAVLGFSWRKTSRYMPRGSVANMLITCCKDNICRIWCETILPEDGLVDINQLDPNVSNNPMFHTQRHKRRFMQRLHHVRHIMQKRKRQQGASNQPAAGVSPLPSCLSHHDFHKFGIHPNSVAPGFHFHLAASINPETDIPLLPVGNSHQHETGFVVHWLNNKELHFSLEMEKNLDELTLCSSSDDGSVATADTPDGHKEKESDSEDLIDLQGPAESYQSQPSIHSELTYKDILRNRRAILRKTRSLAGSESERSVMSTTSTLSSLVSHTSDYIPVTEHSKLGAPDIVDHKIELLLRDWHQSSDMLFSIHPLDGSFLVWLVEWLDESQPGSFRQAQVSFSSRIPQAIPVGDAMTMSSHLLLYCNYGRLDLKSALKDSESKTSDSDKLSTGPHYTANAMGKSSPGQSDNTSMPNVLMLSKHGNGSMNQWQISFAEASKFSTVLSVAHASRACGHRFQTNSAACHPVLPLLLTTSHHNVPQQGTDTVEDSSSFCDLGMKNGNSSISGFCSELILWRVDPVGPLSKSGGISELARINSPEPTAFSNVAWLPTLLPSATLGTYCNSPSALFVASDGTSLRIYQTVIDARTLLTEMVTKRKREVLNMSRSNSSTSSGMVVNTFSSAVPKDLFHIVSLQSTARPGCILELNTITDAKQDWQHIQLIHIFQEQLVMGSKSTQYDLKGQPNLEPFIDLQNVTIFEEHFYLVVIEKLSSGGSVLHMWRIVIASQGHVDGADEYSPDVNFFQDQEAGGVSDSSHGNTPEPTAPQNTDNGPKLSISSTKLCTQPLDLPDGVQVTCATMSAGHLSSSSIYPACFAPYLVSTACTDGRIRFWKCNVLSGEDQSNDISCKKFEWIEWELMIQSDSTSAIRVPGKPITVSCAYSGRVAIAYRKGGVHIKNDNPDNKFVNLCVSIYECESTGGTVWTLEDTIELKNISIPDFKNSVDMSYIYGTEGAEHLDICQGGPQVIITPTQTTPLKNVSIPSAATIHSVKKSLNYKESKLNIIRQKHLVQLDWVTAEDGSHVLTVGVGPKILLYAAVSSEISQASQKDSKVNKTHPSRRILQKSKSMTVQNFVEEIRWMKLRNIELTTADGLPPLPMHISWVRDGILVVGMDNEMHVYSQWKCPGDIGDGFPESTDRVDTRTLTEQNLHTVSSSASLNVSKNFKISPSLSSMKLSPSMSNMSLFVDKKEKKKPDSKTKCELSKSDSLSSIQLMQDYGLFEAARLANPVLPQYHPKQLIELLNFGKILRVKAILAHLLRCIAGGLPSSHFGGADEIQGRQRSFSGRSLSVVGPPSPLPEGSTIPEELQLDYIEISSIPPLPLYALLAADEDTTFSGLDASKTKTANANQDYSALFSPEMEDDELEDPFDDSRPFSASPSSHEPRRSSSAMPTGSPNHFGPMQARMLARHLTYTHLPGLSSLDQMYLLALADTVANTDKQMTNRAAKIGINSNEPVATCTDAIDDCGLQFTLAARHYVYLMNTLTLRQRAQLQVKGLSPAYFVWAFHSDAEEELLNTIPSIQKGEPTWAELRQFGAGWWMRNINKLRRCMEKLAKVAFQVNKNPLDAALYYLAMKKKTLLWGLFRSVDDTKMMHFFKNNFAEDRWRKAALKNAFALLGRQRFHHAAAFFLLAGAVRDAIEVCLNKLDDLQLAMVIIRLYEDELDDTMPQNLRRLLYEECLGCDQYGQNYDPTNVHPDPFIRSMAYWMLKDYSAALGTLLEISIGSARKVENNANEDNYTSNFSVFNFYNYLRTHPLLVRQHLATAANKSKTVLLSGFSHGAQVTAGEKNVTYVDRITPVERRLYFTTAHAHFKNGCPALALEVLSKLPKIIDTENDITKSHSTDSVQSKSVIITGTLDEDMDSNKAQQPDPNKDTSAGFDWSQPVISSQPQTVNNFDWSKPVTSNTPNGFDWSEPVSKIEDVPLKMGFDDYDDEDTKSDSEVESKDKLGHSDGRDDGDDVIGLVSSQTDIMAQQLKFIACLKIMVEELSTLATGFEVDGGQLRYQLYIWLEKEVEVLQKLCNYGYDIDVGSGKSILESKEANLSGVSVSSGTDESSQKGTLHQILLAEKMDFDAKLERMQRRKQWLKANQQLLRTLLSYSVLHGSNGGGLASVRMELILLLQELQQEKTQKQLLSPLPFPTSLPLLSASVASAKTVIADPICHLRGMTQDILHTIIDFKTPPTPNQMLNKVFVLRNLSAALSACIYQCLCDSDSFVVSISDSVDVGMEGFTSTNVVYKDSYLMAGAQRKARISSSDEDIPNSQPSKWPGVSSLRAMLAQDKDEDSPQLNILLCESLIGVYVSLLIHALAMYECNMLYRLLGHTFHEKIWPALFGGGVRKLVKVAAPSELYNKAGRPTDEMTKQRMKLHMKVWGQGGSTHKLIDDKPTYREKFVPPDVSMVNYFMMKPFVHSESAGVDYDSTESISSSEDEDEEELIGARKNDAAMEEHLDPNSYSWSLIRYAVVKYVRHRLLTFLPQIGLELPDLAVTSPLLQAVLKTLEQWEEVLHGKLELFSGPPVDYIPGCFVDSTVNGPTALKYKALLEPINTPFLSGHYSALPAKRLWHYLVNIEYLWDIFIRYIFKKKRPKLDEVDTGGSASSDAATHHEIPMKIIHKDQDVVSTFCLNQANLNCIALATHKELIEMDIAGIINPPVWLEDETEYDIETIKNPTPENVAMQDFLVIETAADSKLQSNGGINLPPTAPGVIPAPMHIPTGSWQTGRGGNVIKGINIPGISNANYSNYLMDRSRRLMRLLTKRPVPGIRKMGSHPHLPYYLTGSHDGSVRLWEWGHNHCIAVARQPGSFPKVTNVLFNNQGNKFGVSDAEGSVCLWQVGLGVNMNKPYLSLKCHNKLTSDFVFVGSSSLLATAGHSTESKNVCIWDTLLPQRNSLVQAFHCHQDSSSSLLYAPQHQVLISSGRKGDICIFDIRQRQLRHTFQAHDTPIKCLALDPNEHFFVSGSHEGDIKVWALGVHGLVYSFPAEHSKASLFRNVGAGVTQLYMSPHDDLFSCGADGALKVRHLPTRDSIVSSL